MRRLNFCYAASRADERAMVSTGMVSLETMEPPERNQLIGNTIYPRIASILRDDGLAGKITGMCLELPVQEQLSCACPPAIAPG